MEDKNVIMDRIIVSEITEKDLQKIKKDLHFIELLSELAKGKGCRLVVSGGYAVDGSLGILTRPHGDIDVEIYGNSDNAGLVNQLIETIQQTEPSFSDTTLLDKERQDYYHSFGVKGKGFGVDIYYVQVTGNPFDSDKYVVKKDGTTTKRQEYGTVNVNLDGVAFEAVDPTSELVDKLYKRHIRGDEPKSKHDQDIDNLKLITDEKEVEARLAGMK
jgi:hypothetical protein